MNMAELLPRKAKLVSLGFRQDETDSIFSALGLQPPKPSKNRSERRPRFPEDGPRSVQTHETARLPRPSSSRKRGASDDLNSNVGVSAPRPKKVKQSSTSVQAPIPVRHVEDEWRESRFQGDPHPVPIRNRLGSAGALDQSRQLPSRKEERATRRSSDRIGLARLRDRVPPKGTVIEKLDIGRERRRKPQTARSSALAKAIKAGPAKANRTVQGTETEAKTKPTHIRFDDSDSSDLSEVDPSYLSSDDQKDLETPWEGDEVSRRNNTADGVSPPQTAWHDFKTPAEPTTPDPDSSNSTSPDSDSVLFGLSPEPDRNSTPTSTPPESKSSGDEYDPADENVPPTLVAPKRKRRQPRPNSPPSRTLRSSVKSPPKKMPQAHKRTFETPAPKSKVQRTPESTDSEEEPLSQTTDPRTSASRESPLAARYPIRSRLPSIPNRSRSSASQGVPILPSTLHELLGEETSLPAPDGGQNGATASSASTSSSKSKTKRSRRTRAKDPVDVSQSILDEDTIGSIARQALGWTGTVTGLRLVTPVPPGKFAQVEPLTLETKRAQKGKRKTPAEGLPKAKKQKRTERDEVRPADDRSSWVRPVPNLQMINGKPPVWAAVRELPSPPASEHWLRSFCHRRVKSFARAYRISGHIRADIITTEDFVRSPPTFIDEPLLMQTAGYGYLLDGFPSPRDAFADGGRVIISHAGGCQSDGRLQAGDAKSPGLLLSKSQDHDSPRMQALIRCKEENVPVVLLAGTKFKDAPFLAGMGPDVRYAVLGYYWVTHMWDEREPAGQSEDGFAVFHTRIKLRFEWVAEQGTPWWTPLIPQKPGHVSRDKFIAPTDKRERTLSPVAEEVPSVKEVVEFPFPVQPEHAIEVDTILPLPYRTFYEGLPVELSSQSHLQGSSPARPSSSSNTYKNSLSPIERCQYQTCDRCDGTSPRIYQEGWMCLFRDCGNFFEGRRDRRDGSAGHLSYFVLDTFTYCPLFLEAGLASIRDCLAPFAIQAWSIDDHRNEMRIFTPDIKQWRGSFCEACGRLSCRENFVKVGCKHCHTFTVDLLRQKYPGCFDDSQPTAIKKPFTDYPAPEGALIRHYHAVPDDARVERVFEMYQSADAAKHFLRNPLRRHKRAFLCSQFTFNAGEPYKFDAACDTIPLDEVAAVKGAIEIITERCTSLPSLEGPPTFNEVLTCAYLEGQKMSYHDDGETGVGTVIAALSLGSDAVMSFKSKTEKKGDHGSVSPPTLLLRHGDVVVMKGNAIQRQWLHAVKPKGFRIAATARLIQPGVMSKAETRTDGGFVAASGIIKGLTKRVPLGFGELIHTKPDVGYSSPIFQE